jgi:hypothetical protein
VWARGPPNTHVDVCVWAWLCWHGRVRVCSTRIPPLGYTAPPGAVRVRGREYMAKGRRQRGGPLLLPAAHKPTGPLRVVQRQLGAACGRGQPAALANRSAPWPRSGPILRQRGLPHRPPSRPAHVAEHEGHGLRGEERHSGPAIKHSVGHSVGQPSSTQRRRPSALPPDVRRAGPLAPGCHTPSPSPAHRHRPPALPGSPRCCARWPTGSAKSRTVVGGERPAVHRAGIRRTPRELAAAAPVHRPAAGRPLPL